MVETDQFLQNDECPRCGTQTEAHRRVAVADEDRVQFQIKVRCQDRCGWFISRSAGVELPGSGEPPKGGAPF